MILPPLIPDIQIPVERLPTPAGHRLRLYQPTRPAKCGYVFYIDPGPLPGVSRAYWGPQIKFGLPQPALNVNMDTWTNVEQLTFRYDADKATTAGRHDPGRRHRRSRSRSPSRRSPR